MSGHEQTFSRTREKEQLGAYFKEVTFICSPTGTGRHTTADHSWPQLAFILRAGGFHPSLTGLMQPSLRSLVSLSKDALKRSF